MIYILENVEKYYKIGFTKNLEQRLKPIKTSNSGTINIVKTFNTKYDSKIEAFLKRYFQSKKIQGEWFDLSKEDLENISTIINKKEKTFDLLKNSTNPFFIN